MSILFAAVLLVAAQTTAGVSAQSGARIPDASIFRSHAKRSLTTLKTPLSEPRQGVHSVLDDAVVRLQTSERALEVMRASGASKSELIAQHNLVSQLRAVVQQEQQQRHVQQKVVEKVEVEEVAALEDNRKDLQVAVRETELAVQVAVDQVELIASPQTDAGFQGTKVATSIEVVEEIRLDTDSVVASREVQPVAHAEMPQLSVEKPQMVVEQSHQATEGTSADQAHPLHASSTKASVISFEAHHEGVSVEPAYSSVHCCTVAAIVLATVAVAVACRRCANPVTRQQSCDDLRTCAEQQTTAKIGIQNIVLLERFPQPKAITVVTGSA